MNAFGLSQHARFITLACARQQGLAAALVAEQFTGREAVNELFRFELDALSTSADIDVEPLIGAELTIALLQPDGKRRAWHGLCTQAGMLGADGGVARYRLRLEPALVQLQRRRDSHLFQDQDVRAIVGELLADYPAVRCDFDVIRKLAPRAICTQYRETDFAFFIRLLASEGLNYRFEHAQDDTVGQARHRLVVFDSLADIPPLPGGSRLRFHGVRATDTDDAIDTWHARRSIAANAIALSSWDPRQLVAPAAEQQSNLDAGVLPPMAIYDGSGECIATGPTTPGGDAAPHGRLMMLALEQENKVFEGAGAVRRLSAGHGFTLTRHGNYPTGANGFTVLWVTHAARNNFKAGVKDGRKPIIPDGTYRNRFGCVRDTVALVPAAVAKPLPSTAPGAQTALVVGLPDAVALTTRDHQVRIQFAWQRGKHPNAGGLNQPSIKGGNAPGDIDSGAWVRVAEGVAGANWGSQFTPRIGTEVLVAYAEGDIDRPFIVGQLHNGMAPPPYDSAALSGVDTANFAAGYNQWQLDDTQNRLRMRLASSGAASALHLGHLGARGSGVELRTDAWTTLRGATGVLLSTSARAATAASVTSTQMDAQDAVALGHGAAKLNDALMQAAVAQQAVTSQDAGAAHTALVAQLDPQQQGKYTGGVGGQATLKAQTGTRALDPAQPVERFGTAAVLLDAAASMSWATPAATVISAGQHLHWTTQFDLHVAAGATLSSVAGGSASLYTHGGGIQALAGNGPVSLQAHTDQLEIVADREVVVVSVSDTIRIQASQKIILQAGRSLVTLDGENITFTCSGNFTAKGGQHLFDCADRAAVSTDPLPSSVASFYNRKVQLKDAGTGAALHEMPYFIRLNSGVVFHGLTDHDGYTDLAQSDSAEMAKVHVGHAALKEIDKFKSES